MKQPHWLVGTLSAGNTTVYSQPTGTANATPSTTETRAICRIEQAATIRHLVVRLATAPGGTATRTITFRKNGADQTLTVTFGAADTSQTDSTHSFTVAAGDLLILKYTATNAPVGSTVSLVWEGETSDGSTSQYMIGISESVLGATNYLPLFSAGGASAVPTVAAQGDALVGAAGTIPSYRIQLESAPTSTHSRTFVLEKNGVAQDGTGGTPTTTITITGAATSGTATFSLAVGAGDLIHCKQTASGSPGISRASGCHTFVATTAGQLSLSSTPTAAPSATATTYNMLASGRAWPGTGEATANLPTPLSPMHVADLRVTLDAPLGASATHAYTLRLDGADTAQAVSLPSSSSGAGPSAGAAVDLTAGHLVAMKCVSVAAASTNRPHWALRLAEGAAVTATASGEPFLWMPV